MGGVRLGYQVRFLLAHQLLHEQRAVLGAVEVGVGRVFAEVLLLMVPVTILVVFRAILKDADFQLLTWHDLKVVHSLGSHLRFGVV